MMFSSPDNSVRRLNSPGATDSLLCGWRVRSELYLPELTAWSGDNRPPDIIIRLGPVPDRLDDLVAEDPSLQVDLKGNCLLRIENIASYLIASAGDQVTVSPQSKVAASEIRVFLLGSVFGLLCHRRGLFPLHASCVDINGRAVALCGATGAGKSTAALHLVRRGHRLVADDVCVIDVQAAKGPRVLPAFPRLKVSKEALGAGKIPSGGLEYDQLGQENNYHYILSQEFSLETLPLGGIFLLQPNTPGVPQECLRLSRPVERIAALGEQVFRRLAGTMMGRSSSIFVAQAVIAESVPIWRLARRFDYSEINRWLEQIEALSVL